MTVTMFYSKIERKSPNSSCSEKQVLVLYSRIPLFKTAVNSSNEILLLINMKSFEKSITFSLLKIVVVRFLKQRNAARKNFLLLRL
jgi:hypothetical protein